MRENLQNMSMFEVQQSTKELSRLRLTLKVEILDYYEVVDKREQRLQSDLTIAYTGLSILGILLVSDLFKLWALLFLAMAAVIIISLISLLVFLFRNSPGSTPAVAHKSEHSQAMTSRDNSSPSYTMHASSPPAPGVSKSNIQSENNPPPKAELENKESLKLLEAQNKSTIRLEILTPRKSVPVDAKKKE